MSIKEFTITSFAEHIGTTKQNISQIISRGEFSFPGYRLDFGLKRTKIIKVDRWFLFHQDDPHIVILSKKESPELALIDANDLLFEKRILTFRFKLEDAKEIEEKADLITNLR